MSIRCPKCATPARVVNTSRRFDNSITRQLTCTKGSCRHIFYSVEVVIEKEHRLKNATSHDRLRSMLRIANANLIRENLKAALAQLENVSTEEMPK